MTFVKNIARGFSGPTVLFVLRFEYIARLKPLTAWEWTEKETAPYLYLFALIGSAFSFLIKKNASARFRKIFLFGSMVLLGLFFVIYKSLANSAPAEGYEWLFDLLA